MYGLVFEKLILLELKTHHNKTKYKGIMVKIVGKRRETDWNLKSNRALQLQFK